MALNDKEHLPKIVTDISGINDVLLAIDPEIIQMRTDISNLLKELYMRTTDALITRWENDFSLKYDASLSLAQRRQRVLNKLARKKVLTWKNLRALIKSNIGENAQFYISNDSANYYFRIMIDPEMEEVFDRSKFTVVGSPKITDDGIASGFSSSNYLTTSNIQLSNNAVFEFRILSTINTSYSYLFSSNNTTTYYDGLKLYREASTLKLVIATSNSTNITETIFTGLQLNRYYDIKIIINNTNIKVLIDGVLTKEINLSSNIYWTNATNTQFIIGTRRTSSGGVETVGVWQGSIDLKQFSITVDGKEVFNGTKTVPKGITGLQQAIKQAKPAYLLFDVVVTDFFKKYCGTFYCNQEPI